MATEITHAQVAEALLAAWTARSEAEVAASASEHCQALADAVMALLKERSVS